MAACLKYLSSYGPDQLDMLNLDLVEAIEKHLFESEVPAMAYARLEQMKCLQAGTLAPIPYVSNDPSSSPTFEEPEEYPEPAKLARGKSKMKQKGRL
jgi:hypothetical protein